MNNYSNNSSKGCVLKVDLEYPKGCREMHYPLAPDNIETERKMLPEYQLKLTDLYSIPISNVKKLVLTFFYKECASLWKLYLRLGLKLKNASCVRIQWIAMVKAIHWIQHRKKEQEQKKMETKIDKCCTS